MRELYEEIFVKPHGFYLDIIDIALVVAMLASVSLAIIMKLYNPQYKLDKALLLRETAIAIILLRFVKIRFFGQDFAIWTPIMWGFLAFASLAVLYELTREHFLVRDEQVSTNSARKLLKGKEII